MQKPWMPSQRTRKGDLRNTQITCMRCGDKIRGPKNLHQKVVCKCGSVKITGDPAMGIGWISTAPGVPLPFVSTDAVKDGAYEFRLGDKKYRVHTKKIMSIPGVSPDNSKTDGKKLIIVPRVIHGHK